MKYFVLCLVFLPLIVSSCTKKHYSQLHGDSVSFYYNNPKAKNIFFASSVDQYKYHAAVKKESDIWEVSMPAEEIFNYFYIVDGVVTLPDCPYTENDDFGSRNCLYVKTM